MEKIDYKKRRKQLYGPTAKRIDIVDVPEMNFLMIDGQGDPNTARRRMAPEKLKTIIRQPMTMDPY